MTLAVILACTAESGALIQRHIISSAGLITAANATAFVDQMLNTAGLTNVNSQNIAQTAATAAAIVTLFNALR